MVEVGKGVWRGDGKGLGGYESEVENFEFIEKIKILLFYNFSTKGIWAFSG